MGLFDKKALEKKYVGGVWVSGGTAQIGVAVGEGEPDRGRLVEVVESDVDRVADVVATIEATVKARDGSAVAWTTALTGDECLIQACAVPRDVQGAPEETRALACLGATPWGDPDTTEALQLGLGYQLDGDRCFIAAAAYSGLVRTYERLRSVNVRMTAEALAFANLIECAHPAIRGMSSVTIGILGSALTAAFVVFDRGKLVLARQADLASAATRRATAARVAVVPEPDLEFDLSYSGMHGAQDRFEGQDRAEQPLDGPEWRAAIFGELRETLGAYSEAGGFLGEIGCVLITGEAAEAFELRHSLPHALGFDVDVIELEPSRVVSTSDPELARRIAEREAALSGLLALLAAGSRDNLLSFTVAPGDEDAPSAGDDARALPRVAALIVRHAVPLVAAFVLVVLVATYWSIRSWEASHRMLVAERRLDVETRRATELRAIAAERADVAARLAHTEQILYAIEALNRRQRAPVQLMSEVRKLLPAGSSLFELSLDRGEAALWAGSFDLGTGAELASKAQALPGVFADVVPSTTVETVAKENELGEQVSAPFEHMRLKARFLPAIPDPAETRVLGEK